MKIRKVIGTIIVVVLVLTTTNVFAGLNLKDYGVDWHDDEDPALRWAQSYYSLWDWPAGVTIDAATYLWDCDSNKVVEWDSGSGMEEVYCSATHQVNDPYGAYETHDYNMY